jgi:hypothetical protein
MLCSVVVVVVVVVTLFILAPIALRSIGEPEVRIGM